MLEQAVGSFRGANSLRRWSCAEVRRGSAVGKRVECLTGQDEWTPGTVIAQYYREEEWDPECFSPYQIELDDRSGRIHAPADDDRCIRAL